MHKKLKKLTLNRETLRKLDVENLQQVAGGYTENSAAYTNCATCSTPTYCGRKCYQVPSSPFLTGCEGCNGE
jgi:natural product precursor